MIKKILFMFTLIIIFIFLAQIIFSKSITIKSIPTNIDDFLQIRDTIAKTPEGGAAIMILALLVYAENEDLGKQCLTIAISLDLLETGSYYKGYQLRKSNMSLIRSQIKKESHIPKSYIKGSTPENGYNIPEGNLMLNFFITKYSGDMGNDLFKVFVECSGASSRPVTLKVNDKGLWKAYEWSSLIVGVRAPKSNKKDDL